MDLTEIISFCNKNNIKKFKNNEIELEFFSQKKEFTEELLNIPKEEILSEEDMLLWSTQHYQETKQPEIEGLI